MTNDDRTLRTEIESPEDLIQYLKDKGAGHNNYKFYSTRESIEKIINERAIYLSRGDGWNDLKDGIEFSGSLRGRIRFGKCFSYSRSESVAMWMLYGGINRDGAMLDLTRSQAAKILNAGTVELGYFDNGFRCVRKLKPGEGYNLFFIDILYCDDDGTACTAKRSDERVDGLETPPSGDGLLTKFYPWSYENEVRLVFEAAMEQVPENASHVRVPLNIETDALRDRIYAAPNSEISSYNRSRLKSSIDWDICRNCNRATAKDCSLTGNSNISTV